MTETIEKGMGVAPVHGPVEALKRYRDRMPEKTKSELARFVGMTPEERLELLFIMLLNTNAMLFDACARLDLMEDLSAELDDGGVTH